MSPRGIPLAALEMLMKQAGADRISDDAKITLKGILEELVSELAQEGQVLALHAGRKTVKGADITLASKHILHKK